MTDQNHAVAIAVLQNDIAQMGKFFGRLDTAIEKIGDLSSSINQMLAAHDQRLDQHDDQMEAIQNRVTDNVKELFKLLNEARTEITIGVASFETRANGLIKDHTDELQKRITALERWRWLVAGGVAVVTVLVGFLGWAIPLVLDHVDKVPTP